MITIRSSKDVSGPTLIGFEATLTTPSGVYEFSSDGPIVDPTSPFSGGLFGAIAWPRSRFQIRPDLIIEQQMFVSHEASDVAISWELRGRLVPAQLVVRPHFAGCAPRGYRDVGFRFDPEEEDGRLAWLPNTRGPKIIADTNGRYQDEPARSTEIVSASCENLIAPGCFEFELSNHPSVLIFSTNDCAKTMTQRLVGAFLAELLENGARPRTEAGVSDETNAHMVAA